MTYVLCRRVTFLLPAVVLAWTALGSSRSAEADEPVRRSYSIKINDRLIGYSTYRLVPDEREGAETIRVDSETLLKFSLLGSEKRTLRTAQTWIKAADQRVVRFDLTQKVNDVATRTVCEFSDSEIKQWTFPVGEDRGDGKTLAHPKDLVILGSNNFGHWQLLLDKVLATASRNAAAVRVYLPDAGIISTFALEKKSEPSKITVDGESVSCAVWSLAGENVALYLDDQGVLVRMELPDQDTVIERTGDNIVKLAEKAAAEEILADRFAKSNIKFDDFLAVRELEATVKANVIGSGPDNPASILTTAIQSFDGEKQREKIEGRFVIRTRAYDPSKAASFPPPADWADSQQEWLKSDLYIESDHGPIVELAGTLTKDADSIWAAVEGIGRWVQEEIRYKIADSPSAKLALETRCGDCGPHSTLMVALLRSQGIPAKLVGGVVYTPSFGGSFGQHAWVEVFVGDDQWIGVDPTTGEFRQLSATHIKMFEGLGGVVAKEIEVTHYDPPNAQGQAWTPGAARKLDWENKVEYTYRYEISGNHLGDETFQIEQKDDDIHLTSHLSIPGQLESKTKLVTLANALPKSFQREYQVQGNDTQVTGQFENGKVNVEISGAKQLKQSVDLPEGCCCFDNNLIASFALICSQLEFEGGKAISVTTFHPSSLNVMQLTFKVEAEREVIKIGEQEWDCWKCLVAPLSNTFWISTEGRLVQIKQGPLVIQLTSKNTAEEPDKR